MCQAIKTKRTNVKTSHKAASLFLFVSALTVTSVQADNKQDVVELEAFYKQVFADEKKPATKKLKNKKIVSQKDPELVAFYEDIFADKQKNSLESVLPRLNSNINANRKRETGATLRPLSKATPKALPVKGKKTSASGKLQNLITELSNTGGDAANKKSVERPKKQQPTITKAAPTSVQNKVTDVPQKVSTKKHTKTAALKNKDPELVAFYDMIFGKEHLSQSESSHVENPLEIEKSKQAETIARPLTNTTVPKAAATVTKSTSTSAKLQGLIENLSQANSAVVDKKVTEKSDIQSKKDPEFVAINKQVVAKEHLSQSESSQVEFPPEIEKSKQVETIDQSLTNITVPKVAATVAKSTSASAKLQDSIDDLKQPNSAVVDKKIAEKTDTQSVSGSVVVSSSQNTNTSALHTQNIVNQKELQISNDEPSNSQNTDLEALFAKAFGKKVKALPSEINVELRINKESLGDVIVYSNKQRNKIDKVQTETFLALLEDILKEHVFKRTKDEISKNDKVTFNTLKKLGVNATYNSSELSLDLQIDSALRKPRILTIRKRSTKGFTRDENKVVGNDSSAYMNLYSNLGLSSGSDPDLKLKLESSFNIKGVVLENSTSYINDQWDINGTRLTYDEPDKLKRYVLGDISTGNRNFQENLQLQGFRLSKEFTMDPELQLRPRGNETFILKTDSEVEVYINDDLQQRFHLKEGIYSLQDIGLYHGANNIRVRIKDEFGKVTEKSSLQFYDSHLLKPDLSLYAFSVGILSNDEAYISEQLNDEPIISAYYQRGLSKSVTLSLDAQISPDSYLLGSETIASVPLGSIKHSLGFSGGKEKDTGFATRFEFKPNIKRQLIGLDTLREDLLELDSTIGRFLTSWTISGEYRNEDFAMINEVPIPEAENNKLRTNLQTQFGFDLGNDWYGSLALSASDYYDAENDLTARLTAIKRFNNGVRLSMGASYNSDNDYAFNMQLSIPLSREKHKRRKDLDFLANTKDNSFNSKLSFQPISIVGKNSLSGSLEHQQTESDNQQKLDLTYKDIRYDARFDALNSNNSGTQQLNFGLNSSLLCVGKSCAISRPVNDSFALISGPSNQKMPIAINNGNGQFRYSNDNDTGLPDNYKALIPKKGSHAVLALDSYRYQRVNIDEATLPNGYDTEKTEFEVFPRYHQGFLIKAGGEPAVILDGFLVDKNKKPLPYKGGQWVPLADEGKTIAFFSNKAGRFRVTSIPAGKYKLELFDYPDMKTIEIIVPDKKGEIYDTGNLVISE